MFNFDDDVKIVSSFKKTSKPHASVESRPSHGFLFRISGEAEYFDGRRRFTVREGEVAFIPMGAAYEYTTSKDSIYLSINFTASVEESEIRVFSFENFHGKAYLLESFSELWKFGGASDKYKCLSIFYDFLSYVSRLEHQDGSNRRKYEIIEPAVEYLKNHIYSPSLKIEKLHALCGLSDTYFRKIFTLKFRVSPQEYVLGARLTHAKSIIESGDYDTIREVAESVGYTDPLYFSKAFRKYYGFPPSDANK